MSRNMLFTVLTGTFLAIILAGCNSPGSTVNNRGAPAAGGDVVYDRGYDAPACANCGTITAIEPVVTEGDATGAGAVIGAVVGGLLGHQVGGGSGKDAATAAGAIGGAVVGSEVEKNQRQATYYQVTVRMNDGTRRVVNVDSARAIRVGTDVEVVGNDLHVR